MKVATRPHNVSELRHKHNDFRLDLRLVNHLFFFFNLFGIDSEEMSDKLDVIASNL